MQIKNCVLTQYRGNSPDRAFQIHGSSVGKTRVPRLGPRPGPRAPGRPPPPGTRLPDLAGCPSGELELGNTTQALD